MQNAGPSTFDPICATLLSELDSARQGWLSLVKNAIAATPGDNVSIINEEFWEQIDIGVLVEDKPASFAFKTLNGATAEATIIGWQVENALAFAVNEKMYIGQDQLEDFVGVLARAAQNDPRCASSLGIVLGNFFSGLPIDNECLAVILSHYLLNDRSRSSGVIKTEEMLLNNLIPFLLGFTYLGTARAFGDPETVTRIQKTFEPFF